MHPLSAAPSALGILFCFGFLVPGLCGLNGLEVSLIFKTPIREGDDLKLLCMFGLRKDVTIDTVKWYKGQREIFRYIARDNEKKEFPFSNLIIDKRRSDMHTLMLKQVPAYMSGNLSCEVTPELPYHVVMKTSSLFVVVPPKEKLKLVTSLGMTNNLLVVNQKMSANCTSSPSKPAVNITFYINDLPVRPDDPNIGVRTQQVLRDDMEFTFAEIEFQLQKQYFKDRKIRLRCGETIGTIFESGSDEFHGELIKPKPQKQGSFFGGIGAAHQIEDLGSLEIYFLAIVTALFGLIHH